MAVNMARRAMMYWRLPMPTRGKRGRSNKRKAPSQPLVTLSPEAKMEIAGLVMVLLAMLTLLSLLSLSRSALTSAWLHLLAQGFGVGQFVIPFGLGVAGILLFLAGMGHGVPLRPRRIAGLLLLFLAAEATIHALAFAPNPGDLARAGKGGGHLGWGIMAGLWSLFGEVGGLVILFCLLLAAAYLVLDRSPAEIGAFLKRAGDAVVSRYRLRHVPVGGGLPQPRADERLFQRPAEPVVHGPRSNGATTVQAARPATTANGLLAPRVIGGTHEWALPPIDQILENDQEQTIDDAELRGKAHTIEETLSHFGVPARVSEIHPGPTVTQFGVEPGFIERRDPQTKEMKRYKVKVNKIQSLANDLALALAATSIRIEAPVPGRAMLGIEIPNKNISPVTLRSVMESDNYERMAGKKLRFALGVDVNGEALAADMAGMPHLLIAGATGSGKSVCINSIICALLCNNTPDELRVIMVDPKRVELTGYNGIPHLLTPVIVDIERVVGTLKWVTKEMERRYDIFSKVGVRNLEGYNASAPGRGDQSMPYLVVFIDELADLMMVAPDDVERSICRIAQMARATGIHLVIATQRPSVDVVTGLIKANFPSRIAFAVSTQIDSRVILDGPGAEQLLGRGDMLFMAPDASKLTRIQGCYVSDAEIERLVTYWRNLAGEPEPSVIPGSPLPPEGTPLVQKPLFNGMANIEDEEEDEDDALLPEAIDLVYKQQHASVSLLQRKLRVGYARAARLMDLLEERGIVGPPEGPTHSRQVLAPPEEEAPADEEFSDEDWEEETKA
jgi:DNA segregation ATPase FtsK/SpoIIIE, S-DNA-T family